MTKGRGCGSKVLITGASGFVGRFIPSLLLAQGYDVHLVGRSVGRADIRWPPGNGSDCVLHELDLLSPENWEDRIRAIGASHLLHLAWITTPGVYWTSPQNLDWIAASVRLVRAFTDGGGKRAVIAGTCAEYDWQFHTLDERTTPIRPGTLYGTAKASLTAMLIAAARPLGISIASGSIFFPYGPYENRNRLLPDVITGLLAGREVACSEGRQLRDFIYVEDAARAFVSLLGSSAEGRVNIASGIALSVREVVETAARIIGREDLVRFGGRPSPLNDPPCLVASLGRLQGEIGFTLEFPIAAGVERTVAWWQSEENG